MAVVRTSAPFGTGTERDRHAPSLTRVGARPVLRRFPPLRASDGSIPSSWAPVGPIQVVTEMRGDIRVVASISTRIVARAWRVDFHRLDLNTSNALLTRKRASTATNSTPAHPALLRGDRTVPPGVNSGASTRRPMSQRMPQRLWQQATERRGANTCTRKPCCD